MRIPEFRMERMQSTWEHRVRYDLSESGVRAITTRELFADDPDALERALATPLGYAQGNGHEALRAAIASFYPGMSAENVCVTTGTSEANFLALTALVAPGDAVAVVLPAYMQVPGWAEAIGADVREVPLVEDRGWQPDLDRARVALRGAKVLYLCDPSNPTGAIVSEASRRELVALGRSEGAWIIADQVYRGAERAGELTRSWSDHERTIVTAGLSKVFGLPGLRIGWVVAPAEIASAVWADHDYTTIAPSTLSALFAERALRSRERLIERARGIIRAQWPVLEAWARRERFAVVPPAAGAIAFVRRDGFVKDDVFVDRLIREESTMLVPGSYLGRDGYLRIGFGMPRETLEAGLERVSSLLRRLD